MFSSFFPISVSRALREQGVSEPYVALLRRLYSQQTAYVMTDTNSREFNIGRGVKQGDPLSSLLFNCILESCFRRLKNSQAKTKVKLKLDDDGEALTNLRFADDV